MPASERKSVYQIITDQILESLDKGVIPWKKPWKVVGGMRNMRGNAYRGVNQFLLQAVAASKGYSSPLWVTFKQAAATGGTVRKGEKGTPVIFWSMFDSKTEPGKKVPVLRYYTVFNVEQCDGVTVVQPAENAPVESIAACEAVVTGMKNPPKITHGGDRACYFPPEDAVRMPSRTSFSKSEEYYSTLFHELGHSTGHASRLNRKGVTDPVMFGSHTYSVEELIAEFTAAFVCGTVGIAPATVENSAAYIDHWKKAGKVDEKLFVTACAAAQKAADCILAGSMTDDAEEAGEEG